MKLTTLLLIVALMQVSAKGFSQKINLNATNVPLEKVLHNIESQTDYVFFFDSKVVKQTVSVKVSNALITDALNACLKGTALTFQIADKTIFIRKKKEQITAPKTGSVPIKVSGRVTDSLNKPLPSATILNNNTNKTLLTNDNGEFVLEANVGDQIIVSFIGYDRYLFSVTEGTGFQNIVLHALVSRLNEVVVFTGYQNIPKERATGSFVQLNNESINRRISTDIISKLEGITPGLLFNRNTVSASRGINDISIRGTNTLFSNSQPLIVLDGFPFDGDINNINPNDIENITVLKDAAAASIWGVRSGNGVIVLTSKKGKRNEKLAIELNANVTASSKPDLFYNPGFLNASDYIDIEQQLFKKGFFDSKIGDPAQIISPVVNILAAQRDGSLTAAEAEAQLNGLRGQDTRSQLSKYFYRRGVLQQYNLNFRGGGDKSDYYFSAGEDHNLATLVGNSNNRITLNANYNFYPMQNLQLSATVNYIKTNATNNNTGENLNAGSSYYKSFPYLQFADANGNVLPIVKGLNYAFAKDATQQGYQDWLYRPLDELRNADNTNRATENRINVGAQYRVIHGLDVSLKYQYENQISNGANYYNTATYYTRNLINQYRQTDASGAYSYPIPTSGGILQQSDGNITSQHLRGQISFDRAISTAHQISAIIGTELTSVVNQSSGNTVYGFDKETGANFSQIDYLSNFNVNPESGARQIPNNLGFAKYTDHYISYFGNAAYTYLDRYTFSVSGRIDRSNLFGVATNNKSVPLYSAGLAWDISKEAFYNLSWLPYLKFRATYGYNANVNKTASAITTLQQESNSYYSGLPYNIVNSPGNPELRWEKVRITNFGLDYSLKNNLLSGSVEYYLKKGMDLFGSSPLPPSTGFVSFFGNTANTSGHGFDIVINSRNIYQHNFKWTSSFLLSHILDKVTKYDAPSSVFTYLAQGDGAGSITPLTGQPIYAIYGFRSGPLTHETGDPQGYLNGKLSTDYTKIIAATQVSDLYFIGPARPATFGSFGNTFNYKNWALSANVIFKLGYYFRRSSTALSYDQIAYGGVNKDYADRWQKPGDELHTSVPSIVMPPADSDRQTFYQYSQALVDKGDHIRLQDIRLSYAFKPFGGENPVFKRLEVFTYLNNVGILWRANHDHLDPDLYSGAYPLPRTLSIGFNSRF